MPRINSLVALTRQFVKHSSALPQVSAVASREFQIFKNEGLVPEPPSAVYGGIHTVTRIPGDGIGPEMMSNVEEVFKAARVPVHFEDVRLNKDFCEESDIERAIRYIRRNGVCLKGSLEKSKGKYTSSLNAKLRSELELHTNIMHCKTLPGIQARHNVDMVIIRQNTEGEYAMVEHEVIPGVMENSKIITKPSSKRLGHYAFQYAREHRRRKITCIHKANIMKVTDGLFLQTIREVSEQYPDIEFTDMIVDNACMQMVMNPQQFDIIVTPNLYGLVLQNLVTGIAGGPGLYSGGNYNELYAVFEPGTRNTGSDMPPNVGNPVAMLQAAVDMLYHLDLYEHAATISWAIYEAIVTDRVHTQDLGGNATTRDVMNSILKYVKAMNDGCGVDLDPK